MPRHFPALDGAPIARRENVIAEHHGVTLTDPYHWLRADNWQEAMREPSKLPDDIKAYLEDENAYYTKAMEDTQDLQEALIAEMRGRIKEDDTTPPQKNGPFYYQTKFETGQEYPHFVRKLVDGGDLSTVLDANVEAEKEAYFQLGGMAVSPGHTTLAWKRDTNGSEFHRMSFRTIETGEDLPHSIEDVGAVAWANETTLFYVKVDENHRPNKVYRHDLTQPDQADVLVYEEQDERYWVALFRSRSGKYVFIETGMNDEGEVHFIDTSDPSAKPTLIAPRVAGQEYYVDHRGDAFFITTNADDAFDFKVMRAPVAAPDRDNWTEVLAHKPGRTIVGFNTLAEWFVWIERENALPVICFAPAGDTAITKAEAIAFDEEAYSLGLDVGPEYETDQVRFTYSSPTTPARTFDFDLATGHRTMVKEQVVPSGHDPSDYVTKRITAVSHDGAEVPVTILHRADTPLDGSAPCLLYGYGSYGASMPASFSSNRLSLVDRGFVYAIAHIRGGEEKGRKWYEDAKFERKPNTFKDFIAAGEALIAAGFTGKGQIVIHGGSAGGLLVGAVANMAPEMLAGVIADVPFVDVLNTILDASLPLTPGEWSQWGNPIESKDAFNAIKGYSPYDNVTAQDYPAMLVTAGVSDPRVTYWEPAKWVAKLRATKTDDNILMLKTNMTSGHFGKSGRFQALEDSARAYAFAIKATGLALS